MYYKEKKMVHLTTSQALGLQKLMIEMGVLKTVPNLVADGNWAGGSQLGAAVLKTLYQKGTQETRYRISETLNRCGKHQHHPVTVFLEELTGYWHVSEAEYATLTGSDGECGSPMTSVATEAVPRRPPGTETGDPGGNAA